MPKLAELQIGSPIFRTEEVEALLRVFGRSEKCNQDISRLATSRNQKRHLWQDVQTRDACSSEAMAKWQNRLSQKYLG